ncbi:MAG: fatty acid desaturase [Pseudomonadota bacterium]
MWNGEGLLGLNWWQLIIATLILTQTTIFAVTIYLHRFSAHRGLELHPAVQHFFRFWLWITTGMGTKDWTAVHRKHHANCETEDDPHSPVTFGIKRVLLEGAELYRAGVTEETLEKYGKGTPDDWLERNVYNRYTMLGIYIMLGIDLLLFGAIGLTIFAIQMMWIPIFAAGVINGLGHHMGYRNFEAPDVSTNIVPWGLIIGGEELHNNHHTYPSSAKFSIKWWEVDIGWGAIVALRTLGLAKVKRLPPVLHKVSAKQEIDSDTMFAVINNRFQVMAQFAKHVVTPLVEQERKAAPVADHGMFDRAKKLLCKNHLFIDELGRHQLARLLDNSHRLRLIYETRLELQSLWENRTANADELLRGLTEWCQKAEQSGIQALEDFAQTLRTYSTQPQPA